MRRSADRWTLIALTVVVNVALGTSPTARAQGAPGSSDTVAVRLERVPFPALIGDPAFFVGGPGGFVMVDYTTMQIFRADANGAWTDSLTSRGSGPGEFRTISGVSFDAEGRVWVADGGNGRLTQLTPELRVLRSLSTPAPLRSFSPLGNGQRFLAIPSSVQDLALVVKVDGSMEQRIAFATADEALNPILRERYLIRVSDSLSVIQYRWFNRRIGLRADGTVAFAAGDRSRIPEVVTIPMGKSTGYRIASGAAPFALSTAVHGDQLLVLRASTDEPSEGRVVSVFDVHSGVLRRTLVLRRSVVRLAANGQVLLAVAETDDGFAMYQVVW